MRGTAASPIRNLRSEKYSALPQAAIKATREKKKRLERDISRILFPHEAGAVICLAPRLLAGTSGRPGPGRAIPWGPRLALLRMGFTLPLTLPSGR